MTRKAFLPNRDNAKILYSVLLAVILVSSSFVLIIGSPTPAAAQSVTIQTSADSHGGKFFGEGLLQVIVTDSSANDDLTVEDITVDIQATGGGGPGSSGAFDIPETSASSGRFEFYLMHSDANAISPDDIDPENAAGVEGAAGAGSTAAPIITFGPMGGGADVGMPPGGANLYHDIILEITATSNTATIQYSETSALLEIDGDEYGPDSIVYLVIDDQDANLNPTDRDAFVVTAADMNILFSSTGATFDPAGTIQFLETGDDSARFEAEFDISPQDTASPQEIIPTEETVMLTLNDMANYNDAGFDNLENNSPDTSDASFSIDAKDGEINLLGTVTFSSELKMDVIDADQNRDSGNEDSLPSSVVVYVDNPGGDIEVFNLEETDDNTGIFEPDLPNNELKISFLSDSASSNSTNGILDIRADDLLSNIIIMYNDTLDDNEVIGSMTVADLSDVEVFTTTTPLTLSAGSLELVPSVAAFSDNFDIRLLDGDLNDNPRAIETYEIMLLNDGGADNEFDLARGGFVISDIATFEFRYDNVPMDFSFPFNFTLTETGMNTGVFVGSDQLGDVLSPAGVTEGGKLLWVRYNDKTSSPFTVATAILQVAPAVVLSSISCNPASPPDSYCVNPNEPKWGIDYIDTAWTAYVEASGFYSLVMNVTNPSGTVTDTETGFFAVPPGGTMGSVGFGGISFSSSDIGTNTITAALYDNSNNLIAQTSTTVNVQKHPASIILNQPSNVVAGTSLTLSGFIEDAVTGESLDGASISFDNGGTLLGDGSLHIQDTTSSSVIFDDPDDVSTFYCATCISDSGINLGNTILQIDAGGTIDVPPTSGIVHLQIDGMGDKVFTLEVTEVNGDTFIQGGAGNPNAPVTLFLSSPDYIDSIRVLSVDNRGDGSGGPFGIASIVTSDPLGDPKEQHVIDFELLAVNPLGGPLVVDGGSFFSSGDSPTVAADLGYSAQAHFAGDALHDAADSLVVVFSLSEETWGRLGEQSFTPVGDDGAGVLVANCAVDALGHIDDADGDAICDDWEINGIPYQYTYETSPGVFRTESDRYSLCFDYLAQLDCPSTRQKDIYVELDYMQYHRPIQNAIDRVIATFAHAPVGPPAGGGQSGIALHVKIDNEIPHSDVTEAWTDPVGGEERDPDDFDDMKATYFGTEDDLFGEDPGLSDATKAARKDAILDAKEQAYHYGVFVHSIGSCGPSGLAEVGGNDFMVALGCDFDGLYVSPDPLHPEHQDPSPNDGLKYTVGTEDQQAGTFMHELGHNLNLHHGGPRKEGNTAVPSADYTLNCKPNYQSVMSYSRQMGNFFTSKGYPMVLDYSNQTLPVLNENQLDETTGLAGDYDSLIVFRTPSVTLKLRVDSTYVRGGAVETISWDGDASDSNHAAIMNINNFAITGCNSSPDVIETMNGHNDWSNLKYDFRKSLQYIDGIHDNPVKLPEMTGEIAHEIMTQALELDTIAPEGIVTINSGAEYSNSRTLELMLDCSDNSDIGCTNVRISKDGSLDDELFEEFANMKSVTVDADGLATIIVEYKDGNENLSPMAEDSIIVDMVDPTVSSSQNGASYMVGESPAAPVYSCNDDRSGIASCVADVTTLDATTGTHSYHVTATDRAGNDYVATISYSVHYQFSGFMEPAKTDAKKGSAVVVKFKLTDSSGNPISTATAQIFVDGNPGTSTGKSNTGNNFRYDSTAKQYLFNLDTKGLSIGTHTVMVRLNDDATYSFTLKLT